MKMSIYITLWGFYLLHLGYLQAQKYAWKIKGHASLKKNITPPIPETLCVQNVRAIVVCGFLIKLCKKI